MRPYFIQRNRQQDEYNIGKDERRSAEEQEEKTAIRDAQNINKR